MLKVPSLVAGYRFEGNANDFSGNGHNGTVYGATLTTGKFGKCYSFDGVDDYISIPDSNDWIFGDFTFSTWCYITQLNKFNPLLSISQNRDNRWTLEVTDTNAVRIYVCMNSITLGILLSEDSIIDINTWYHIVCQRQNTITKLYINTQERSFSDSYDLGSKPLKNLTTPLEIGKRYTGSKYYRLSGLVDEVALFNKALSVSDIKRLYLGLHPLGA